MVNESWRLWAPAAAFVVVALAEALHARRVRRIRFLAFGPAGSPRTWVQAVPFARIVAATALVWGLAVLSTLTFKAQDPDPEADPSKHLLVCWDASPSMTCVDAGPEGDQSRTERASDVVKAILKRLDITDTRVSIVAFYTSAKPVLIESWDLGVVHNVLDGLPLSYAFEVGKTKLQEGVQEALHIARRWPPHSTTVVIVSDGDTVPGKKLPTRPPSVEDVIVVGMGDPYRGTPIAGTTSRQDERALKKLAVRLGGEYWNGNTKHVPSSVIEGLGMRPPQIETERTLRDWAFAAVLSGSGLLALVPIFLTLWGGLDRQRRRQPTNRSRSLSLAPRATSTRTGIPT